MSQQKIKDIAVEVAEAVGKEAKLAATPYAEKIDALKTLTALYTALQKHPMGDEEDTARDGFDFTKGVNAPEEPSHDSGAVTSIRARQRPGARTQG